MVCNLIVLSQNKIKGPKSQSKNLSITHKIERDWFFDFYRNIISPIDGNRCQMYPSCSVYSQAVFRNYGPVFGFCLTLDRLSRCGNDLYRYEYFIKDAVEYYIDTLSKQGN